MGLSGRSPLSHHTDVPHTEAEFLEVSGTKSLIVFLQSSHGTIREITSLPHHTDAAYRGRILRGNWNKSLDSFPPALPWDYQGDYLSLPPYRCAAYRGRILGRNWDKSRDSFPPALPWDYQGDHLSPTIQMCRIERPNSWT